MMRRGLVGVVVALAALAAFSLPTRAARPEPCPGGRFVITAGPIVAPGEILVLGGTSASLTSGCTTVSARLKGRRDGNTKLTVRFVGCEGLGRAVLRGLLTDTCTALTGTLRAPKATPKTRAVTGARSTCGDGVLDAAAGEACDQDDDAACPGACQTDCTCPPSTTTTTLPPATTGVFLLTDSNVIARVDGTAPQAIKDVHLVTGLVFGERLIGIDFRPANGDLMGIGYIDQGATAGLRVYRIDPATGAATPISSGPVSFTDAGVWGIDFNPTADRIRVVNDSNDNGRLHPDTGARVDTPVNDTNLAPTGRDVIGVAYDRNVPGGMGTDTTLYTISRTFSSLLTIGGLNSTPSPNAGALTTVGALGIMLSQSRDGGFDIVGTPGTAYAALTDSMNRTALYTVNLTTGAATELALIGDGATSFVALAVGPGGVAVP